MTDVDSGAIRRFRWPAEYYSTPTPQAILPRPVAYGCGVASVLVLLVVFAGGAFLSSGGMVDFMDFVIGMSFGELRYDASVTEQQKKVLTDEVSVLRENVRTKKVTVASLQPFLEALRRASADGTVSSEEAASLRKTAHDLNTRR